MPDREKVVRGLETCSNADEVGCDQCPYYGAQGERGCQSTMQMDALALLREQDIGHWIFLTDCSNSGVYCSGCNTKVFDRYPFKKKFSYFCPHCGTRMEGEVERR